jgi:hypothetical protein
VVAQIALEVGYESEAAFARLQAYGRNATRRLAEGPGERSARAGSSPAAVVEFPGLRRA